MELLQLLDKVLKYLASTYPKRQNFSLSQIKTDILIHYPELAEESIDSQLAFVLNKLADDGFIEIDSRESGRHGIFGTSYIHSYSIKLDGVYFIEQKGGYTKQIEVQEQRENLEFESVKASVTTSNSVKETNESIKELNRKTEMFYDFQKTLTIVIALAALASAFGAIAPLFKDSKRISPNLQDSLQIMQRKVQQLDSTLQHEILHPHLQEIKKNDSLPHP